MSAITRRDLMTVGRFVRIWIFTAAVRPKQWN
jgi:hypothetical protein